MKFPVDLLADVSLAELEQSAHNYMNNLLYSNPDSSEHLTISASTKVIIDISSVGFIPLYGSDDTWKILALFSPSDPFIAVGLYLLDRWWAVEDILKTADPARDGVLEVETVGDRIVLYILNRVIYRGKEITSDELPFLCHGEKDYAKIVWNNGEAVGFYSVKPSGTICNSFSVRTYQLSVMDSIFVRKCQRRKGFGLQMLVDFVLSFKEESLGLRYPLTKSMYKVCEKYLCQYPGDADLLWEVESIGGPKQRTNVARKIMAIDISVSKNLSFSEESLLTPDVAEKVLKETTAVERSVETMEEVTVLRATKEIDDVPVVSQHRSSHSKQRITGEKMTEDKSEKVIRIEEIEAETPRKERVSVQRKTELHDSQELEQTEVLLSVFKEKAEDIVDTVPEGGPTMRSSKPPTVLMSGDLAEDHVTSATMTEEQHVEDDATQDLTNKSHDSQITVENVASETQETEVCEKEEEADIPFGGDAEENILPIELDEEMSRKDEETPANDEQVKGGYGEGKTEDRVVREGRRSAATAGQQSKQAQEETEETSVTEETLVDETKAVLEEAEEIKETRDRKNEDNNEEEAAVQKIENPEPEVEIEQVEAVEGVSLREQDTVEEEQSTASVTCADREEVASIQECAEETPDEGKVPSDKDTIADETTIVHQTADKAEEGSTAAKEIHITETKDSITEEIEEKDGEVDAPQKDDAEDTLNPNVEKVSDETEAPVVESRVLRSGEKLTTTTPVSKTTKRGHKQNVQVEMLVEKSADTDELAVETRILRNGRRCAPATTRRKSKRARIQCQPEEQRDEETASAQEMEGEEGEVGQESPEKNGEKAEEEGKIMKMEIKPSNDAEQGEAESAPGEEYVEADTEQTKDSLIEETAVLEGDNSKTDLVESDVIQISSAEVEETNSIEEEGITDIEKSAPVTEVVSDTAIAEAEALDEGAHEVAEEDAPAATTMSLRSKTKTLHPKLTQRSRVQKTQEPVKTKHQQMEEENLEDVETQEVPLITDNSPEQREQREEQTEAEETSATGHEADEDIAEYIDKETSDSRVVESLGDNTQSVDKEEEEKVESDEDKDNMTDGFSDNQHIKKLEEGSEEENLENAVKAGEKGSILNSTLDTDEEVETPGVSQKQKNDEQNMSVESVLIGKRVLRSRTVPSVIITPQSKSRRRSTKVRIAEESSPDEEKSPQSSKRSLRKRKSTDVTPPARKFKRSSRVQEVLQ